MKRRTKIAVLALGAGLLLANPGDAVRAQDKSEKAEMRRLPGLEAALPELRNGGLVIYFRHAASDVSSGTTDDKADLARCETQRNLSALGRQQAAAIGQAFRALGIPVGSVLASPFCRCRDTAQLAFGRHAVDRDLTFAIGLPAAERGRLALALKGRLSARPAKGVNDIVVSHTANLREATGIWPKHEGMAYIFRPLANGGFEAIAEVQPEDWGKPAGLRPPERGR